MPCFSGDRNHTGYVTLGGDSAEKRVLITWLPLPQPSEICPTEDVSGSEIMDNNMGEEL